MLTKSDLLDALAPTKANIKVQGYSERDFFDVVMKALCDRTEQSDKRGGRGREQPQVLH